MDVYVGEPYTITVTVINSTFQLPAPGMQVLFTSNNPNVDPHKGTVSTLTDENGVATMTYTSTRVSNGHNHDIRVRVPITGVTNGWLLSFDAHAQIQQLLAQVTYTPISPQVNQPVTFDASDSVGPIVDVRWSFDTPSNWLNFSTNPTRTHTFTSAGTYTIYLYVRDGSGSDDTTVRTVTVVAAGHSNKPIPNFAYEPTSPEAGQQVNFTSTSTDPNDGGFIYQWLWDFGDGNTSTSATPTNVFADAGTYSVKLTVTDNFGNTNSTTSSVVVVPVNQPPIIDTATAVSPVHAGTTSALTGVAHDLDAGDVLTYTWALTSGSGGSIADAHASQTTLQTSSQPQTYTLTLTVTDNHGGSVTREDIIVTTINTGPIAVANAIPATANRGDTIQLVSTGTNDPDGDTLQYLWAVTTKPSGSTPTLTGANTPTATFTTDTLGNYEVTLSVTDPTGSTGSDKVSIVIINQDPIIDSVTVPSNVHAGTNAQITGAAHDLDAGDVLTYTWALTSGPGSLDNVIANPVTLTTASQPATYTLTLTVTDNHGGSTTWNQPITLTTLNAKPTVNAGLDQTIHAGTTATLTPTASDTDGDTLTYTWSTSGGVLQQDPATGKATLGTSTTPATYTLTLTVTDGHGGSASDTLIITTDNTRPIATITVETAPPYHRGDPITLNAKASTDDNGDPLTYTWALITLPSGSAAKLSATTGDTVSFTPDKLDNGQGVYEVMLTADDGHTGTDTDQVTLTVLNMNPIIDSVTVPSNVHAGTNAQITGAAHDLDAGDVLTYTWALTSGPGSLDNVIANPVTLTTASQPATYTLTLTVTDNHGGSTTWNQPITLTTLNAKPTVNAGLDQTIHAGTTATLTPTASDTDGDTLTYTWSTSGGVLQQDPATGKATLGTSTTPATYTLTLTVTDGHGGSASDTLIITTDNTRPIATITVETAPPYHRGDPITLNAKASTDDNGDPLTYTWALITLPSGSAAKLSATTGDTVSFTPDKLDNGQGVYEVMLTADDGHTGTDTDQVTLTVLNMNPIIDSVTVPSNVHAGTNAQITGAAHDLDAGDVLTYTWALTSGPGSLDNVIANPVTLTTASQPATYTLTLTVTDNHGGSTTWNQPITLTTLNAKPTVNAGLDQTIHAGTTATLTPTASDTDGDTLTYTWSTSGGVLQQDPATGKATLGTSTTPATYTLTLTVTDGHGGSASDTLIITTDNTRPIATITVETAPPYHRGDPITLNAKASTDDNGDPLTYTWALITLPSGSAAKLSATTGDTVSFTPDKLDNGQGVYEVMLTADDGHTGTDTDQVTLTVLNMNPIIDSVTVPSNVHAGTNAQITGAAHDLDAGDVLTYTWALTSGPGSLDNVIANPVTLTTASQPATYTLTLTVTDNHGGSTTWNQPITLTTLNAKPTVNAGLDQTIHAGTTATLTPTASDTDGDTLTYTWSTSGGVLQQDPATGKATLGTSTTPATYTLTLTVTDGHGGSASDTLIITTDNTRPIATITVETAPPYHRGDPITLNAKASTDDNGDPLTYTWALITLPSGSAAKLSATTGDTVSFTPDKLDNGQGVYEVMLTADDGHTGTDTDQVTLTVLNMNPIIDSVTVPSNVHAGTNAQITGAAHDLDAGDVLTYTWALTSGPGSLDNVIANPVTLTTASQPATYTLTLTVTDNHGGSTTWNQPITLTTLNAKPTVNAGLDQTIHAGTTATLTPTASDTDGDTLTYTWSTSGGVLQQDPATGKATLGTSTTPATYTLTLTVTDGHGGSASDTLIITTDNTRPIATITVETAPPYHRGDPITLNAKASTDDNGDPLTYTWALITLPSGSAAKLSATTGDTVSFTPDKLDNGQGVYEVMLTADDGHTGTDTDQVTLTVLNMNPIIDSVTVPSNVHAGTNAQITGAAHDLDAGDVLTYTWALTSGPGSLDNVIANPVTLTTASQPATYTLTLTVTDNHGGSTTWNQPITLTTLNAKPTVNAGLDQTIHAGTTATLTPTASDTDGDTLTYTWSTSGGVLQQDPATGKATLGTSTTPATYTLTLTVTDGHGGSASDTLIITTDNTRPIATITVETAPPYHRGDPITLNAKASTDDNGDPLTYTWALITLPSGSAAKLSATTGDTVSFTPDKLDNGQGVYEVMLTADDGHTGTDTDQVTLTVLNMNPIIDSVTVPSNVHAGTNAQITGAAHDLDAGDVLTYTWALTSGPGSLDNVIANPVTLTTASQPATYTLTLTVTDNHGGSTTWNQPITLTTLNAKPTVNAGLDQTIHAGTTATLTPTASDTDGDTLTYTWSTSGGVLQQDPATGKATLGTSTTPATYTLTLTVTDGHGGSASDTLIITTRNTAPSVTLAASPAATAHNDATITLTTATSDSDGDTLAYTWAPVASGGTLTPSADGTSATFSATDFSNYPVTVTVKDPTGATGSDTITLVIIDHAPTANAGPAQTIHAGTSVTLRGSGTDPDHDTLTYAWVITSKPAGSNPTLSGADTATPTLQTPATSTTESYGLTLTVTDDHGVTGTDTVTVTATNAAPNAAFTASPTSVQTGGTIAFSSTSSDSDGSITSYRWDFGDGASSTAQSPSHTYNTAGSYTVTLTVTDNGGATDSVTHGITVSAPPPAPTPTPETPTPIPTPEPTPTPEAPAPTPTPTDEYQIAPNSAPPHEIIGLEKYEADGVITYEGEGFRLVRDTNTGFVHMEWDIKNTLDIPIEVSPYISLYGCDVNRTGTSAPFVFAAEQNCTTCSGSASANTVLSDGTRHNAAGIHLDFIGSTLNIPTTSEATTKTNATGVVGKSVRNKYLTSHNRTNQTTSKVSTTNATQLKALVCKQSSSVGNVAGKKLILQPGESLTVNSTMTSKDWASGGCSPVNHGLVNINVKAGNDSYKLYKADQIIVFGKEESNICSAS